MIFVVVVDIHGFLETGKSSIDLTKVILPDCLVQLGEFLQLGNNIATVLLRTYGKEGVGGLEAPMPVYDLSDTLTAT